LLLLVQFVASEKTGFVGSVCVAPLGVAVYVIDEFLKLIETHVNRPIFGATK
jgi:hypothetical protein